MDLSSDNALYDCNKRLYQKGLESKFRTRQQNQFSNNILTDHNQPRYKKNKNNESHIDRELKNCTFKPQLYNSSYNNNLLNNTMLNYSNYNCGLNKSGIEGSGNINDFLTRQKFMMK